MTSHIFKFLRPDCYSMFAVVPLHLINAILINDYIWLMLSERRLKFHLDALKQES